MYKIEQESYGFRITVSESMNMDEAEQLMLELIETLSAQTNPFSLIIDVRGQVPFEPEVAKKVAKTHAACMRMSCERTAIIVESPVVKGQAAQICLSASSRTCDRIIDASKVSDWEDKALAWVAHAAEPASPSCSKEPV